MILVGHQQCIFGVHYHQIIGTQCSYQLIFSMHIVVTALNSYGVANFNIALAILWQQIEQ